ncbi:RNA 2',3'-cyclic phosphodiesterase [bioreactor metagenome]|uniref:RNA 2',3'-cyclic phosphodiesterase n=1 Tax=bioreactor metagenome TaxID=1076179 RepID=A0A645B7Z9_9ZZZZ
MRLFIGIDLPEELKRELLGFQTELKTLGVKGLWKAQDNFHITLEYLGELDPSTVPLLSETLSQVARKHPSFRLNVGGLGSFPSFKRPHTLWTSVGGSLKELNILRDELHHELAQKRFALEDRPFKPHLTLASRPELDGLDTASAQAKQLGEFVVAEVVLFESKVIRGKRIYTHIFEERLC